MILAIDPIKAANKIKQELKKHKITDVEINKKPGVGEIIAPHYELKVGNENVVFIYEPLACHSYNTIKINNKSVKIASIDTMLTFYLAFIYANRPYYDTHRILCIASYLLQVQIRNRLEQKGVLKRFPITCYGKQHTIENIRAEKAHKFNDLRNNPHNEEFQKYFLRYLPQKSMKKKSMKKKSMKKKSMKKKRNL